MFELETWSLAVLVVASLAWSVRSFRERSRGVALGALASATVLSAATALSAADALPWREGGFGMSLLAVSGAYAIGAAVASRAARSPRARSAAVVACVVTLVASAGLYAHALAPVPEIVRHAPPEEAALILDAAREEAMRLPEFAGVLVLVAGLVLLTGRQAPRRIELMGVGARAVS